jgi:hypothetical protein
MVCKRNTFRSGIAATIGRVNGRLTIGRANDANADTRNMLKQTFVVIYFL